MIQRKFRLLLTKEKPTPDKTGTYTFYSEDGLGQIWTTPDLNEALDLYKNMLGTYTSNQMALVDMTNTVITVNDKDLEDQFIAITPDKVVVVNDGDVFGIQLELPTGYVIVNKDDDIWNSVVTLLENYGLTDVEFSPMGITAVNPTGTPIVGSSIICKGLFRLYKQDDRADHYVTSSFTIAM